MRELLGRLTERLGYRREAEVNPDGHDDTDHGRLERAHRG
jgi:hypothetical protein